MKRSYVWRWWCVPTSSDVTTSSATTGVAAPTAGAVCPKPRPATSRLVRARPALSITPSVRPANAPNADQTRGKSIRLHVVRFVVLLVLTTAVLMLITMAAGQLR